ncbi:MAG TPA: restriction endonuclease subunit S [Candidatus Desulfovibrio gallistercoris]|nr:restriction endonuclease subunit S [Candidatus Desulfovibrio gallistercoris]
MSWQKVTIASVCEGIYDGPHATPAPSESGAIFLGIHNFVNGRLDLSNVKYISFDDLPKWTRRVTPQENDIVFSYEATLNLYAIIPPDFLGCLGRRMALIRVNPQKIYYKFLYYYFFSPEWRALIAEKTILGATVDRIPLTTFPQFLISLPPRATQHRIADILSAYDDLIENNQKQIQLLEEAAQRLYKEWFVDLRFPGHENTRIVDGVPEGWEVCTIDDISSLRKTAIKAPNIPPGIPYIGLEHIPRKDFCLSSWGDSSDVSSTKYQYKENDILFGKIRPYFHKVGFSINNGVTSTDTLVMTAKKDSLWPILLLSVFSKDFVNYSYQNCKEGSKMPRADWNIMKSYKVLNPEKNILKKFNNNIFSITKKIKILAHQNNIISETRNMLLPKLMKKI